MPVDMTKRVIIIVSTYPLFGQADMVDTRKFSDRATAVRLIAALRSAGVPTTWSIARPVA